MGTKTNFEGEECITHGPWGGSDGEAWTFMPKGFIKKITIVHGKLIHSIKFQSETESSFFGGKGGSRTDTICIDYPNEYLTSISGTFGRYAGSVIITSLCFCTNRNRFGPYGSDPYRYGPYAVPAANRFSYDGKSGVIVGFYGRFSKYLDAVGIYVINKSYEEGNSTNEPCSKMSRKATPRETGPWGATSGGKPWDDGVFCTIKQVLVLVEEPLNVIYGIQFIYVKRDAKSVLSPMHGGKCRDKMELVSVVNLDGTDEYLTGISGFYGPIEGYNGLKAITSITFHTNKRKHGPYGEESGVGYTCFTSTASPGKVVGFHGRSDSFLTAVGVHMEYF